MYTINKIERKNWFNLKLENFYGKIDRPSFASNLIKPNWIELDSIKTNQLRRPFGQQIKTIPNKLLDNIDNLNMIGQTEFMNFVKIQISQNLILNQLLIHHSHSEQISDAINYEANLFVDYFQIIGLIMDMGVSFRLNYFK